MNFIENSLAPIFIGDECVLADSAHLITKHAASSTYVVITDTNVSSLWLESFLETFSSTERRVLSHIVPEGEETKCREMKDRIEDFLIQNACGRDTCLIAFGGGVIGDLVGFTASTYLRGVPYVQIPTTLMAMVDSSVGGKTAIDLKQAKNAVGSFYHPKVVLISSVFLRTLPLRQMRNGFAEVVKAAFLDSEDFIELVERMSTRLAKESSNAPQHDREWIPIVHRSVELKLKYVLADVHETNGVRGLLNLGHTVGHGLEWTCSAQLLHGEAVSIGLVVEGKLGRHLGITPHNVVGRLEFILGNCGLPIHAPILDLDARKRFMGFVENDKKNRMGKIHMALLEAVGKCKGHKPLAVDRETFCAFVFNNIEITFPPGRIDAPVTITPPGSKSITNRVLEVALLGRGTSKIQGALLSDDTLHMIRCLQALSSTRNVVMEGDGSITVIGGEGNLHCPTENLFVGNSGTTARFLLSVCGLCQETKDSSQILITGCDRMNEGRPIAPLIHALKRWGATIEFPNKVDRLPAVIQQKDKDGLVGGCTSIDPSMSTQFVSSLLLVAPLTKTKSYIALTKPVESSQPYIDMTVSLMKSFGALVDIASSPSGLTYEVENCGYVNPPRYVVEPDASSASYLLACAALLGGKVTIEHLGLNSLQGDSKFASYVLQNMGCNVRYTKDSIMVEHDASIPLRAIHVDLSDLSDTFITAAVVMAGCNGMSTIRGIKNQQHKESNRIDAVIAELKKIGVVAEMSSDSLRIHGKSLDEIVVPPNTVIHCYDDHRIAMAFGILGMRVKGIRLDDMYCVEKTYPQFWDDLKTHFGVQIKPFTREHEDRTVTSCVRFAVGSEQERDLIEHVCRCNNWNFVDLLDEDIIHDYWNKDLALKTSGASALHPIDPILNKIAQDTPITTVIVTNTDPSFSELQSVSVGVMDLQGTTKGKILFPYEMIVDRSNLDCDLFVKDVMRWVEYLSAPKMSKDELEMYLKAMHMICLTYSSYLHLDAQAIEVICEGCDVVEFRVDLLSNYSCRSLRQELYHLRKVTSLPVMFTLRSKAHGGKQDLDPLVVKELLCFGVSQGCEYIDIEMDLPNEIILEIITRCKKSKTVLSFHNPTGCDLFHARKYARRAVSLGADVVKIVMKANQIEDGVRLADVVKSETDRAAIILCTGSLGGLSRALNRTLTPVTHPSLSAAAPGQLSLRELNTLRTNLGMHTKKLFYVVGNPVSKSLSPFIHNTSFQLLGLPHEYSRFETNDIESLRAIVKDPNFGGCSVTIPLKVEAIQLAEEISPDAERIGAINTLIPMGCVDSDEIVLYGENTDWIALKRLAFTHLTPQNRLINGIVLGAGGAARAALYALHQMGVRNIWIWNRTTSRAEELCNSFSAAKVQVVNVTNISGIEWDVVISTLPSTADLDLLPQELLHGRETVVIDMAYIPGDTTPFVNMIKCIRPDVTVVNGLEVLVEQAVEQFKLWTCHIAPKRTIWQKLDEHFN